MNKFQYQNYLDFLRLLAVTLVFFFHLNQKNFPFGFIGVDIFFVISGYVITQSLFHYKFLNNNFSFLNFYSKRILRLFPALFVMLVIFITFYLSFMSWSDFELKITIKSLISSIFGISNLYFFNNLDQFDYFLIDEHSIPLLHTWSLSLEEQFYIFYPFILIFIFIFFKEKKKFINVFVIFLISIYLLSLIVFCGNFRISHFYLPFGRVWELILGCFLFVIKNDYTRNCLNRKYINFFLLTTVLVIILNFNSILIKFDKILILISVFITSLIINNNKIIPKYICKNNYVSFLGRSSYSIYLYHMPVIYFSNIFFNGIDFYFYSIVMTFFFSFFSYKFVEPIRYNKSLLKIFPNIIKGTTALIVILFFVIQLNEIKLRNLVYDLILKTNNFATIYNLNKKSISNRKLAKWELDVDHCSKKEESFKRSTYLNCIKSDASNNDLFFLVGDSYGEHFINTLANITSIKNLYYARLDNENFESDIDLDNTHNLFNNYLNTSINFKKNKTVIISISYPNDLNHIKIQTFLSKFKNNEKFIFIAPHKVFNIRDECKTLNDNLVLNCIASNNIEQNSKIIKVIEKLDTRKNIFIYDFKDKFCKKEICYSYLIEKDKFVFSDNFSHLTKEFAEFLSKDFEKFLDKNIFK
tara:strand:- start:116 stop:2035 length:1920 start_codon:yes stop_codon:yes gene_type:complete